MRQDKCWVCVVLGGVTVSCDVMRCGVVLCCVVLCGCANMSIVRIKFHFIACRHIVFIFNRGCSCPVYIPVLCVPPICVLSVYLSPMPFSSSSLQVRTQLERQSFIIDKVSQIMSGVPDPVDQNLVSVLEVSPR